MQSNGIFTVPLNKTKEATNMIPMFAHQLTQKGV